MRKIFTLLVCAAVMTAFAGIGICADANRSKNSPVKKEFTKEEMLADIKYDLETYDEIAGSVPGIKAGKGREGDAVYTYNGVKIEEMSREDLRPLFSRVRQLAIKLRTESIQRQLEIVRQARTASNAASGGAAMPPRLPAPLRTPQVSSIPSAPPSLPSAPRTPPSPPPASQRR